jgi:hypothetical protein
MKCYLCGFDINGIHYLTRRMTLCEMCYRKNKVARDQGPVFLLTQNKICVEMSRKDAKGFLESGPVLEEVKTVMENFLRGESPWLASPR